MLERLRKIWTMSWFDITLIEIEIGNYVIELVFDEPIVDSSTQTAPVHVDITAMQDLPAAVTVEPTALDQAISCVTPEQVAQATLARDTECVYLQEPEDVYAAIAQKPLVVELSRRLEALHGVDYAAPLAATLHKAFQETRWALSFTPKPGARGVEHRRFELSTHELLVVTDGMNLLTPELEDQVVQRALEIAAPKTEETPQKRSSRGLVRSGGRLPNSKTRKKKKKGVRSVFGSIRVDIGRSYLSMSPLG